MKIILFIIVLIEVKFIIMEPLLGLGIRPTPPCVSTIGLPTTAPPTIPSVTIGLPTIAPPPCSKQPSSTVEPPSPPSTMGPSTSSPSNTSKCGCSTNAPPTSPSSTIGPSTSSPSTTSQCGCSTKAPPSGNCLLIGTTLQQALCCNIATKIISPITSLLSESCVKNLVVNLLSCILQITDTNVANQLLASIIDLLNKLAKNLDPVLCNVGQVLAIVLNGLPINQVLLTVGNLLQGLLSDLLNNLIGSLVAPNGTVGSVSNLLQKILTSLSQLLGGGSGSVVAGGGTGGSILGGAGGLNLGLLLNQVLGGQGGSLLGL